jgi:acetyl-CoA carboxylase carboxyl transferase subunit beta
MGAPSLIEDNLWTKCPSCDRMIYSKELEDNLKVCGYCSYHFPLSSESRFASVFDDGKYEKIESAKIKDDPLKYKDTKKYIDRLKEARQKTGFQDCVSIAKGKIRDKKVVVLVMDFSFMGGSMGLAFGKSFEKAVNLAIKDRASLIGFTASGGARMQEGILSLMQMPATIAALCKLKENNLPYINVFTHPTTGGVLASFAMLGDIHIAEPRALIGFAGARVIEKTIKHKLPEGFQRAEFLRDHGMVDIVVHRHNLKEKLGSIIGYIGR